MRSGRMKWGSVVLIVLVLVGVPLGVFLVARESSPVPPSMADSNTIIDIRGAIGGVRAGEARADVERLLGHGVATPHRRGPFSGARGKLVIMTYPASGLVVVYVPGKTQQPVVFAVATTSTRYHTPDGLGVGSSLAEAQHSAGITCSPQPGGYACEGGLGFEKPVTSFVVHHGHVTEVILAAVAD